MSETDPTSDVAALTVQLLSAYLANNTVASDDLADLIRTTRAALTEDASAATAEVEPETFTPAVSVRKSLASSGHIISLIDGKPYKTLKRHLSSHGLTPETYRSRYNLPATYPMVAPDYAAHRRAVAQKIGLGSRKPASEAEEAQELPPLDGPEAAMDDAAAAPAKPAAGDSKPAKRAAGGKPATARTKKAAPEVAPSAAESASTQAASQPDGPEAPAPSTTKRRSSKPAKSKAATTGESAAAEPGAAGTASSPEPEAAQPTDDGADAGKPKRGRRKTASADAAAPTNEAGNDEGDANAAGKPATKRSSGKPKKAPRMARAPKEASAATADAAD